MAGYKEHFKGKKITVMGLGLLGRGVKVTAFLAECGADLIVTDVKSKKELEPSLKSLKKYKNITYVLGRHRLQDFEGRDMIIKSAGVPLGSRFIARAKNQKIPVEMDASLFLKCAPDITAIGVTGTRGKSSVSYLIHHILDTHRKVKKSKKNVFLAGNVRGAATLPLLKKIKKGDSIVLELDSWQLQGFGDSKISPHIAVFTTFMQDHQNYYVSMREYFNDKANIFKYQKDEDFLVTGKSAFDAIQKYWKKHIESTVALARTSMLPKDWKLVTPGEHHRENAAIAMQVAEILKIKPDITRSAIASFKGVEGRLECVKSKRGVSIFNDNNATTPEATRAALEAFPSGKIVLIAGGTDKELDYSSLGPVINERVKRLVLLPGSGTDKLRKFLTIPSSEHDSLKEAVEVAWKECEEGDVLLFSPAGSSFELFNNEYERNDEFMEYARKL